MKPEVITLIKSLNKIFEKHQLTYYLIGATARDLHLAADTGIRNVRKTEDVDVAVLMASESDFIAFKNLLIATGEFTEGQGHDPVKLYYKGIIELDILPFGGIENENRELVLTTPTLFAMDIPGFMELLPFTQEVDLEEIKVKTTTLEGIVLLKLFANNAQPDRSKDIADIQTIIQHYFELCQEDIFEIHYDVLELYDVRKHNFKSLVSAQVIGRKFKEILKNSPELIEKTKQILAKRATEEWQAILIGFEEHH